MLITFCKKNINTNKLIDIAISNYFNIMNFPKFDYKIIKEDTGKPCLCPKSLNISVSHTYNMVVVGVSNENIGIDVEYNKKIVDYKKISKRFFKKEITSLKQFYEHFTLAEATTKETQLPLPKTMKMEKFNGKIIPFFSDYTLAVSNKNEKIFLIEHYYR